MSQVWWLNACSPHPGTSREIWTVPVLFISSKFFEDGILIVIQYLGIPG